MHYLAIVIASFVSFAIGGIWYGPLFGKAYRELMGVTEGTMSMSNAKLSFTHAMALRFLTTLVLTYVLSYFLIFFGAASIGAALMLALVIWLGFIATVMMSAVLFGNCPVKLYLINIGNELVGILAAALVLTYLPW